MPTMKKVETIEWKFHSPNFKRIPTLIRILCMKIFLFCFLHVLGVIKINLTLLIINNCLLYDFSIIINSFQKIFKKGHIFLPVQILILNSKYIGMCINNIAIEIEVDTIQ